MEMVIILGIRWQMNCPKPSAGSSIEFQLKIDEFSTQGEIFKVFKACYIFVHQYCKHLAVGLLYLASIISAWLAN